MTDNPFECMGAEPQECEHPQGVTRRDFVKQTTLGAIGAMAAGAGISASSAEAATRSTSRFVPRGTPRPNIVLIITDQERSPQYWPEGWADANLPNRKRLADRGVTFNRAFCNTAMCSPSRTTLFTGLYPAQHKVEHTLTVDGSLSPEEATLQPTMQNMAKMLASAGYNVQYRGKWHLTKDVTCVTDASSADDLEKHGFHGWQPPDAGQDTNPAHFGGGCADYDRRWAAQAAEFLRSNEAKSSRPFALIVSLINPHDTLAYPTTWDAQAGNAQQGYCYNYQDQAPGCFEQGISLPPTEGEQLHANYKPTAQTQYLVLLAAGLGILPDGSGPLDENQKLAYVNFYAYLHKVVDEHIGTVIDALEDNPALNRRTMVIRLSDHGEMGLSHGGMRQKAFNAYEETLRVPIVFSNPVLFPGGGAKTNALASLVDIMPTLATLANVPNRDQWDLKGKDLMPIILDAARNPGNPTVSVQDTVLFTGDDDNPACANPQPVVKNPRHIRCIRDERYKYTVYFDPCGDAPAESELYDLVNDPEELHNMAHPDNVAYYNPGLIAQMQAKMESKMAETGTSFTPNSPYCG